MSRGQRNQNNSHQPTNSLDVDPEVIRAIIHQQTQKMQLEAARLKLDEKRLDQDGKLAEESLKLNNEWLRNAPVHHRKNIKLYAIIAIILVLIFLGFIGLCLYLKMEDFVMKFLGWVSHLVAGVIGYFVGKSTNKKQQSKTDSTEEIEAFPEE